MEVLLAAWSDSPPLVVSYAPSSTMFAQLARAAAHPTSAARLLAVGDPLYDSPPTSRAPSSRPSHGVQITQLEYPEGPRGGLEPGDVLLTYDGQETLESRQFSQWLKEAWAQRKAARTREPLKPTVTILREGKIRSFVLDPHPVKVTHRNWRGGSVPRLSMPRTSLPRLPGTRREVEAIAALFPAAESTTLLGEQATEAAAQRLAASGELARYRFLHFATHGTADPDVAMSSALILAPGDGGRPPSDPSAAASDGRITAEQILNTWTLDADLIVLSACETGLGKKVNGEGYLGFAQALFIKGARGLVLSQWSVSDAATALLMVRFYRNLLGQRPGLSRPLPKAEALDEAKRWLRNLTRDEVIRELDAIQERGKVRPLAAPGGSAAAQPSLPSAPAGVRPFEHPRFWAAFILIGDRS